MSTLASSLLSLNPFCFLVSNLVGRETSRARVIRNCFLFPVTSTIAFLPSSLFRLCEEYARYSKEIRSLFYIDFSPFPFFFGLSNYSFQDASMIRRVALNSIIRRGEVNDGRSAFLASCLMFPAVGVISDRINFGNGDRKVERVKNYL